MTNFKKILKSKYISFRNRQRFPHNRGYCTICESETIFYEYDSWLRDNYQCGKCGSIPRNRALVNALNRFYPEWKKLCIHESSPGGTLSAFLKAASTGYSSSHYYEDTGRGEYKEGYRSEDLTQLTFKDQSFDLFITSDVFEHVFQPDKAFSEIARVLKPGGAHIFTMPWYPAIEKSIQRASLQNGGIIYLEEAVYHGNPISNEGSLVTYDWGTDFCSFIYAASHLPTTIYLEKNRQLGLDADFLEVFISNKSDNLI